MAEMAGVNVNTVRTVYARLEQEGLLVSEHGRGTFVGGASSESRASDREYRRELLRQIVELERQAAYYTRHRRRSARAAASQAGQPAPAGDRAHGGARCDGDARGTPAARRGERLQLIAADRAALEEQKLAARTGELNAAGRRSRGTAASPPRVVSGPGAWVLKWRT